MVYISVFTKRKEKDYGIIFRKRGYNVSKDKEKTIDFCKSTVGVVTGGADFVRYSYDRRK